LKYLLACDFGVISSAAKTPGQNVDKRRANTHIRWRVRALADLAIEWNIDRLYPENIHAVLLLMFPNGETCSAVTQFG
jgi:hypothetical protein